MEDIGGIELLYDQEPELKGKLVHLELSTRR
jgi:hypothetical protein